MRHPIDIAVMFVALWLLGSMVVDILTPKELTFYLIAAATGPAAIGTALCYFLRIPKIDFTMIVVSLWLVASMAIEWISPAPLPDFMIGSALAPPLIVGAVLHWHRYRLDARRRNIEKKTKAEERPPAAANPVWETPGSPVPELTFNAIIKLNARVSLRPIQTGLA